MKSLRLQLQSIRNPGCTLCSLHESSKHVCILGRGSPTSKVVLIGEAPGREESATGKPFMGRSGKLLDELMDEVNLRGYITNICKCRPPDNRKPTPTEAAVCTSQYLFDELKIIDPFIIVLLGKTAIEAFFKSCPVKLHTVNSLPGDCFGRRYIPTWHPAYCLRSGKIAKADLRKALELAKIESEIPF